MDDIFGRVHFMFVEISKHTQSVCPLCLSCIYLLTSLFTNSHRWWKTRDGHSFPKPQNKGFTKNTFSNQKLIHIELQFAVQLDLFMKFFLRKQPRVMIATLSIERFVEERSDVVLHMHIRILLKTKQMTT